MAKLKIDNFLDLVQRSELVERDQLNRLLSDLKKQSGEDPVADTDFVAGKLVESGLLTRWQCDNLCEGRHKGFFLGKYKLLQHLGAGGMSNVYLAEHVLMQRRVAIKVLPKQRVNDSSYLERFYREAQAAAKLDHRNIVRAYDVDNDGPNHYMVMEYVEGRDLQALVKQDGPLGYPKAIEYIRQAAEGLAHAHKAHLIHRDVKPANLLLDRNNIVKVLDLGLAKFTDDTNSLTLAYDENVLGTADYLAPEQAVDSHGVDARADIYGLGCSLYYLLTGHPPYPDGTLPQRLIAHQRSPAPDIRQERPDAPDDLVAIFLKMMAKKPDDRYQSAREVADVMAEWLKNHGACSESGSRGSGSSGRLRGSSAARRVQSQTKPAETPSSGRLGARERAGQSGAGGSSAGGDGGGSVELAGAATDVSVGQSSGAGGSSNPSGRKAGGGSDASNAARAALPKAQRLVEPDPLAELFAEVNAARTPSVQPITMSSDAEFLAYRKRRQSIPWWLWALVGGGMLLVALLMLLALLFAD